MDFEDILNWRRVDDRLSLSGQPSEAQLRLLAEAGVTDVINLGPHDNKGALEDEPGVVAAAGMVYHYIPVDFEAPSAADYAEFTALMAALQNKRVHLHCIYNARVTAFMLRYARDGLGGGKVAEAEARMDGIWRPGGVWARFLGDTENEVQPNRYAGYDY